MADPSACGFVNVTGPGINSLLQGNGHRFWDTEHPTTEARPLFTGLAAHSLRKPASLVLLGTALRGLAGWRAARGRIRGA